MEILVINFLPNPAVAGWSIPVACIVDGVYVEAELMPDERAVGGPGRLACMRAELSQAKRDGDRYALHHGPHISIKRRKLSFLNEIELFEQDGRARRFRFRKMFLAQPQASYVVPVRDPWWFQLAEALGFATVGAALSLLALFVYAQLQ